MKTETCRLYSRVYSWIFLPKVVKIL